MYTLQVINVQFNIKLVFIDDELLYFTIFASLSLWSSNCLLFFSFCLHLYFSGIRIDIMS